ncbi:LysM peptidoglycan-binding domain-containing protein [Nitratifractor sp.]|uniref:C40 family peptidase n=1 Tax=Nitratifractor sp. TaxID=2268144 RepID=UPI0025CE36A3|nr:LysM peptidoglycan-binding domain-containing protein [Nitratifractor sp.]
MRHTFVPLLLLWTVSASFLSASRLPSHPTEKRENLYTVQSGDSLYTIAHHYHITVGTLRQANNLGEQNLIRPGQKLRIPSIGTAASTRAAVSLQHSEKKQKVAQKGIRKDSNKSKRHQSSVAKASQTYKVRAGDTLSVIAQQHGLSTRELREANHLGNEALIRVGQTLILPVKTPATAKKSEKHVAKASKEKTEKADSRQKASAQNTPALYEVQSGDTLFSIARKYHTPLKDLMSLNKIAPTDLIHPGQKLKIPGITYRTVATQGKAEKQQTKKIAETSKPVIYTVKHGDSLWAIAHKHKVSIATIRRLNKLKAGQTLHSGMKLVLKEGEKGKRAIPAEKKKKAQIYTVKRGDTLWGIAHKHKTTVAKLRQLNKMDKKAVIHSGMKLTVGYTDIPETRLAQKSKKPAKKVKVAVKKSQKKKTRLAQAKKNRSKHGKADRRIHNALAALNAKGSSHGSGGGDYNVIRIAKRYLGRRYVWGAEGPNTFDCSGFTQYVMRKSKGVRIPRVSRKQAYYGKYVSRRNLKPGDLIFFDTSHRRRGYVNHVGIYIGNNKFIHASSARHRVVITSLNRPFYRARFKWGRRIN